MHQYADLFIFLVLQDMKDMRACCDSLLSAAAATTNSAYGTCFIWSENRIVYLLSNLPFVVAREFYHL